MAYNIQILQNNEYIQYSSEYRSLEEYYILPHIKELLQSKKKFLSNENIPSIKIYNGTTTDICICDVYIKDNIIYRKDNLPSIIFYTHKHMVSAELYVYDNLYVDIPNTTFKKEYYADGNLKTEFIYLSYNQIVIKSFYKSGGIKSIQYEKINDLFFYNKSRRWYWGKTHNTSGFASIEYYESGAIQAQSYYLDGKRQQTELAYIKKLKKTYPEAYAAVLKENATNMFD